MIWNCNAIRRSVNAASSNYSFKNLIIIVSQIERSLNISFSSSVITRSSFYGSVDKVNCILRIILNSKSICIYMNSSINSSNWCKQNLSCCSKSNRVGNYSRSKSAKSRVCLNICPFSFKGFSSCCSLNMIIYNKIF